MIVENQTLEGWANTEHLKPAILQTINDFQRSYLDLIDPAQHQAARATLKTFVALVVQQLQNPYQFEIFHRAIRSPFDYYQFGLDFIRPLIDFKHSRVEGKDIIAHMVAQTQAGENVILLANHQTEPDPQIISLMLEPFASEFAAKMIFVAGHRVVSDPVAVPMSKGRNLLCIYSKKHIEHDPHTKADKLKHNMRTMKKMSELLAEGGHCIYVAPSGGRDRLGINGKPEVARFDVQSIEMFKLTAEQAGPPAHFYPLVLKTYDVMPPPDEVKNELGEERRIKFAPVFLDFRPEVAMDAFEGDRKSRRIKRAEYIWNQVETAYARFE